MVLMYSAGQESVKRDCFNAFWMSHHLFCVFWACLLIHGPIFYWFALAPLPLYFYGRIQRDRESVDKVYLEEVVIEPPNVIKLVMNNRTVGNGDDRTLWTHRESEWPVALDASLAESGLSFRAFAKAQREEHREQARAREAARPRTRRVPKAQQPPPASAVAT